MYPNTTVLPVPSDQPFPVSCENPNRAAEASCYLRFPDDSPNSNLAGNAPNASPSYRSSTQSELFTPSGSACIKSAKHPQAQKTLDVSPDPFPLATDSCYMSQYTEGAETEQLLYCLHSVYYRNTFKEHIPPQSLLELDPHVCCSCSKTRKLF